MSNDTANKTFSPESDTIWSPPEEVIRDEAWCMLQAIIEKK